MGRAILGPLADPDAVAAINHQFGADRPLVLRYLGWIGNFLLGDMGQSYVFRSPVAPFVGAALLNSLKLAAVAFVIVVPLSIGAGVYAATRVGALAGPDDQHRRAVADGGAGVRVRHCADPAAGRLAALAADLRRDTAGHGLRWSNCAA